MSSIIDCGIYKVPSGIPPPKYGVWTLLRNGHYLSGHSYDLAAELYGIDFRDYIRFDDSKPIDSLVGFDGRGWQGASYYFNDFTYYATGPDEGTYSYTLPDNKDPSNIVGIGISMKPYTYFWFDDYTVSFKSISEWNTRKYTLAKKTRPLSSGEDPYYQPLDVAGMAISDKYCYAWYKDGYRSYGRSWDLDYNHAASKIRCINILTSVLI